MKTIMGPGIFLAQFAGDQAPFNSLDGMAHCCLLYTSPARVVEPSFGSDHGGQKAGGVAH